MNTSRREDEDKRAWQHSDGALWFLLTLLGVVNVWCWGMFLPMALDGHAGAVSNLLDSFGFTAVFLAVISVSYRKPLLLMFGGIALAVCFYLSSIFLEPIVTGANIGIAIRVGAIAVAAFSVAGGMLFSYAVKTKVL